MKRIVIACDGTWNRPEEDPEKDHPTNVLKLARAVAPADTEGVQQVVFYDWGVGSYHDKVKGGAFGAGIDKNIMDAYRFIVQNYDPEDELFLFGFSRGSYTVRSLAGMLFNCGVLRRPKANLIQRAYDMYKDREVHPDDATSDRFRRRNSVRTDLRIRFVGVFDTVGSLGVPFRMFGFLNEKHLFHDNKIGPIIDCARHALAIDEQRDDFEPTIWKKRRGLDLRQLWFAGVHSDVGGGYAPDDRGRTLSDIPLEWVMGEAALAGLALEGHLEKGLRGDPRAEQHDELEGFYRVLGVHRRPLAAGTGIHPSVRQRWQRRSTYRPKKLVQHVERHGWTRVVDG